MDARFRPRLSCDGEVTPALAQSRSCQHRDLKPLPESMAFSQRQHFSVSQNVSHLGIVEMARVLRHNVWPRLLLGLIVVPPGIEQGNRVTNDNHPTDSNCDKNSSLSITKGFFTYYTQGAFLSQKEC